MEWGSTSNLGELGAHASIAWDAHVSLSNAGARVV